MIKSKETYAGIRNTNKVKIGKIKTRRGRMIEGRERNIRII